MIKNVWNVSNSEFQKINFGNHDYIEPNPKNFAYMCIYGFNELEDEPPKVNKDKWRCGLNIQFENLSKKDKEFEEKSLNHEKTRVIVSFIKRLNVIEDPINLVIQCYLGNCRSAAIGLFINNILNLNLSHYNDLKMYNTTIYKRLYKIWSQDKFEELSKRHFFMF